MFQTDSPGKAFVFHFNILGDGIVHAEFVVVFLSRFPPTPFPGKGTKGGALKKGAKGTRRSHGCGDKATAGTLGACYPELALLPSALQMVTHGSLYVAATKCTFVGPMHSEAKQYQNVRVWSGKVYCRAVQGDRWLMPPEILYSSKAFSKAF